MLTEEGSKLRYEEASLYLRGAIQLDNLILGRSSDLSVLRKIATILRHKNVFDCISVRNVLKESGEDVRGITKVADLAAFIERHANAIEALGPFSERTELERYYNILLQLSRSSLKERVSSHHHLAQG